LKFKCLQKYLDQSGWEIEKFRKFEFSKNTKKKTASLEKNMLVWSYRGGRRGEKKEARVSL
jgi:hypothetical protein